MSPEFAYDTAKFLWVCGPAGHGKSVLCARLIESLVEKSTLPLAYFFCSSDAESQRQPLAIIRSWGLQAIARNQSVFEQAMKRLRANDTVLASRADIWELFRFIASIIPNYTFVVDGLDECLRSYDDLGGDGTNNRKGLLTELKSSVKNTRSRVMIVSRDEGDIRSELSPSVANFTGHST